MKIKKITSLIMIASIIVLCIPTQINGWLSTTTYEICNSINICISWILKIAAFIVTITCITGTIQYARHSKQEKKQKNKDVLTGLAMTITQFMFLFGGSLWVKEIGMETYWSNGVRFQFNEIDGYISNGIRIIALISIIVYIVASIIYFAKSKKEKVEKLENVIRWQLITALIVIGLLILATKW